IAFSTAAVALWTILSSSAATASGRCFPSALGMYLRREVSVKVCFVGRPRQSIHPGGGIAFEREERHPQAVDADVVEECSEPLLLPLPCGLPYALQRLCHALPSLC